MVLICPRIHFYEINDQVWSVPLFIPERQYVRLISTIRFPQYLREKVQSCLTLCWKFRVPILQRSSPAQLVANTLSRTLSKSVTAYTYVDFCAGAGGPTPFIEKYLNAQLSSSGSPSTSFEHTKDQVKDPMLRLPRIVDSVADDGAVKFVLTDLHPHVPDWTKASKRSENLSFISEPVDAANAPASLNRQDGKKIFRLYNLAFHHFDNELGMAILKNTIETADGFGCVHNCNPFQKCKTYIIVVSLNSKNEQYPLLSQYFSWGYSCSSLRPFTSGDLLGISSSPTLYQ